MIILSRVPLYNFEKNRIEITTSNGSSIIACPLVAAEICLASRCLEMDVSAVLFWLHNSGLQASCHSIIVRINNSSFHLGPGTQVQNLCHFVEIMNELISIGDNTQVSFNAESRLGRIQKHVALEIFQKHRNTADLPQDLPVLTEHCGDRKDSTDRSKCPNWSPRFHFY
jgi:hypothetical protein